MSCCCVVVLWTGTRCVEAIFIVFAILLDVPSITTTTNKTISYEHRYNASSNSRASHLEVSLKRGAPARSFVHHATVFHGTAEQVHPPKTSDASAASKRKKRHTYAMDSLLLYPHQKPAGSRREYNPQHHPWIRCVLVMQRKKRENAIHMHMNAQRNSPG